MELSFRIVLDEAVAAFIARFKQALCASRTYGDTPHMPEMSLHDAEGLLRAHGGYDWLLSGKQFWSVGEIVEEFDKVGLKVSHDAVTRWIMPLPFTDEFGGKIGLRASRNDLILYFAGRLRGSDSVGEKSGT